ncbi:MAG: HAMP domain-containing sensor histidine kinase [Patescibacteria group bacterium]|nr:HAMP domain-containing sensor histidine kinase [Patescibacteria group bacterium]
MNFKNLVAQLNIFKQCRKYSVPLRQCPQFIFLIMGIIIITAMLITYWFGINRIDNPEIVAFIVTIVTIILMILSFIISQGFERLAEASRMKSEFINIVSHQLRSPLTNMKWATEFLITETIDKISAQQAEYFNILQENCSRMNALINDLLTVSKLQQKKFNGNIEKISLYDLLKNIIEKTKAYTIASNIEIKLKIDKNLPKISADASQMNTVLENLINNAIRYTPNNNGKENKIIEIKLEQRKNNIYFEIKDNGIGIPKQDQKYIFQKFFRSRNVLKHQTQGSGLGLYITKSIVEKQEGKIGFISKEEQGTTFWFFLPIK